MQIRPKHRPQWTEEELDVIFSKGKVSSIFSPPEYRVDDYGNLMKRDKYGDIIVNLVGKLTIFFQSPMVELIFLVIFVLLIYLRTEVAK